MSCIELFVKNADGELRVWLWGVEESWDVLVRNEMACEFVEESSK